MNIKTQTQQPYPVKRDRHTLRFDVMEQLPGGDERYICTMQVPHNELFPTPVEELEELVISTRPSLARKKFRIAL